MNRQDAKSAKDVANFVLGALGVLAVE